MTTSYDSNGFDPPAAIAQVLVRNLETDQSKSNVRMLLDTGAEISVMPLQVATQLGLSIREEPRLKLEGFDGVLRAARVCLAHLEFELLLVDGEFVVLDQENGILGRDILNRGVLELDGPALSWTFSKPV